MKTLFYVVSVLILAVAGALGFAYSGLLDVSASAPEPEPIRWLLETTRERSVSRRAADIVVPDLADDARVAAGARAFGEMCAGCHGAPGREPVLGAQDMNPPPPDLSKVVRQGKPAELFWVIKHGLRMTGMPAWGHTHSDSQLWELVAFIERLPGLSGEAFQRLAEAGSEHGHDHQHGEPAPTEGQGHDHGGHAH